MKPPSGHSLLGEMVKQATHSPLFMLKAGIITKGLGDRGDEMNSFLLVILPPPSILEHSLNLDEVIVL